MDWPLFWQYVLVMAAVTYLTRMVPLVIFKRRISSRFIRSFLVYVPYAVLGAMTLPGILYSTGNVITAAAGLLVALVLSWMNRSLLTVAMCAAAAVFIAQLALGMGI